MTTKDDKRSSTSTYKATPRSNTDTLRNLIAREELDDRFRQIIRENRDRDFFEALRSHTSHWIGLMVANLMELHDRKDALASPKEAEWWYRESIHQEVFRACVEWGVIVLARSDTERTFKQRLQKRAAAKSAQSRSTASRRARFLEWAIAENRKDPTESKRSVARRYAKLHGDVSEDTLRRYLAAIRTVEYDGDSTG